MDGREGGTQGGETPRDEVGKHEGTRGTEGSHGIDVKEARFELKEAEYRDIRRLLARAKAL